MLHPRPLPLAVAVALTVAAGLAIAQEHTRSHASASAAAVAATPGPSGDGRHHAKGQTATRLLSVGSRALTGHEEESGPSMPQRMHHPALYKAAPE